ncbi:trypsin [Roseiarcus fermentans]|uniref:Trypsin n=1 Tax=Roseiarcus fermentans TaxID=1473586 RepID=A0A366FTT0_9HYPH|nr:trypsin-like serine protease [Roseiarcus fermentans]RBP18082.1 trypsin [Roseiarcus fermentans]
MRFRHSLARLALALALASGRPDAHALVGAQPDGRFADRVAMVLMRGPGEAGFCSALVLDARTLLTAAHCLRAVRDMAVHYRDASGAPVVIPVEAALAHPQYRPDAIRARAVSIDIALVRTAAPLDSRFVGAALASGDGPEVGESVILTGFGAMSDGDWKSGGSLRSVTLAVREPASPVLVWAADPGGRVAGACSGDSGAPMWSRDGATALAIATWAQAPHGRGCGGLTQGPRLAPLRRWIEDARRRLDGGD